MTRVTRSPAKMMRKDLAEKMRSPATSAIYDNENQLDYILKIGYIEDADCTH